MKSTGSSAAKAPVIPAVLETEEVKYRQKCKELKRRIKEIEDTNEASAINISRTKRAIKRLRLERAFILEKLEERTFLKVDDSDGTPSPPGSPIQHSLLKLYNGDLSAPETAPIPLNIDAGFTPGIVSKMKERKNGKKDVEDSTNLLNQQPAGTSAIRGKRNIPPRDPNMPKRPQNAYIIFCDLERDRVRAEMEKQQPGESFDLTKAMAESWREMNENDKRLYQKLYEEDKLRYFKQMAAYSSPNLTTSEKKERARAEKALREMEVKKDVHSVASAYEDEHEHEQEDENEDELDHEDENENENENEQERGQEQEQEEERELEMKNNSHNNENENKSPPDIKVEVEDNNDNITQSVSIQSNIPEVSESLNDNSTPVKEQTTDSVDDAILESSNEVKISEPKPLEAASVESNNPFTPANEGVPPLRQEEQGLGTSNDVVEETIADNIDVSDTISVSNVAEPVAPVMTVEKDQASTEPVTVEIVEKNPSEATTSIVDAPLTSEPVLNPPSTAESTANETMELDSK